MNWLIKLLQKMKNKLFPIKKYVLNEHYKMNYDHEERFPMVIQVLKGEYKDITFAYDALHIADDDKLAYTIKVIESPATGDFTSDPKFVTMSTDIFASVIEAAFSNYKEVRSEILNDEDDRTDYFEELTPKRTVREKSSTVSKKLVFARQKRKASVSTDTRLHSKVQPPAERGGSEDITEQ